MKTMFTTRRLLTLLLMAACLATASDLNAQSREGRSRSGRFSPEMIERMKARRAGAQPAQPTPQKTDDAKKDDKKKTDDKKPDDSKKEPAVKPVGRPDKPTGKADPKELEAKLGKDGKIQLSFKGQKWEDILNWLAKISHSQLDWTEMPGKTVDLTTQQSYTVDEVRDIINRMLLDRGFTLVRNGELLRVVNLKNLDAGMLPRVEPEDLENRDTYEFVKVSFQLDPLLAETAIEELKPMLSAHHKATAMKKLNRLEVIDVVANLREVYRLILREQSDDGKERMFANIPLKYTRASDIKEQLEALLGVEKKSSAPMTQQQMQAAQRAAQMAAKNKGAKPSGDKKAKVYILANERNNSIVVNAPADKIAFVKQAILVLDVPTENGGFGATMQDMKVYRLSGLDPETLVKTLYKQGNLSPRTQLDIDKQNNAVIAVCSILDHGKIKMMVDTLDGSSRHIKVINLRRIPADSLAGTLRHMINGDDGKKKSTSRRSYYGYYGSREPEKKKDSFRVDADVENNRLLLWANDIELATVEEFLVQLGEMPPPGGNRNTTRVIEIAPGDQTEELLRRLQQAWPSFGPNKLLVEPAPESPAEKDEEEAQPEKKETTRDTRTQIEPKKEPLPAKNRVASAPNSVDERRRSIEARDFDSFITLAQLKKEIPADADGEEDASEQLEPAETPRSKFPKRFDRRRDRERSQTPEHGPITITRSPKGGIIIQSDDTRALDMLQQLIDELAPPPDDFVEYHLKNADVWWIASKLEDYFEDKEKKDTGRRNYWDYYYGSNDNNDKGPNRLSNRKPIKFISEVDTKTIIVQGGDAGQLATVAKLIKIWDTPEPENTKSARKSKLYPIKYSKAKVIAETIKEVYRDLLSENDKSLQSGKEKKDKKQSARTIYTYIDTGGDDGKHSPVRFKGLLSIGIDELSNTLIVSAPEWLISTVGEMIEKLDQAAMPTSTVHVLQVDRRLNSALLQKKLAEVFSARPVPGAGQKGGKQQGQKGNANGNGAANGGNAGK